LLRTAGQSWLCVLFLGDTDEMRDTKNARPSPTSAIRARYGQLDSLDDSADFTAKLGQ
jgi:hypothetical protein